MSNNRLRLRMKINKFFLSVGVIWSILFACLSFYWALGGMMGVRSLGGSIYEMALHPSPSFLAFVWISGLMKVLGAAMLMMLFLYSKIPKLLYLLIKITGILLFFYGLLNFIGYSLHAIGLLHYELDAYAAFWRIVFWEPYWMLGGIFYFFSIQRT